MQSPRNCCHRRTVSLAVLVRGSKVRKSERRSSTNLNAYPFESRQLTMEQRFVGDDLGIQVSYKVAGVHIDAERRCSSSDASDKNTAHDNDDGGGGGSSTDDDDDDKENENEDER